MGMWWGLNEKMPLKSLISTLLAWVDIGGFSPLSIPLGTFIPEREAEELQILAPGLLIPRLRSLFAFLNPERLCCIPSRAICFLWSSLFFFFLRKSSKAKGEKGYNEHPYAALDSTINDLPCLPHCFLFQKIWIIWKWLADTMSLDNTHTWA